MGDLVDRILLAVLSVLSVFLMLGGGYGLFLFCDYARNGWVTTGCLLLWLVVAAILIVSLRYMHSGS